MSGRLLVFTAGSEWSIACKGVLAPGNLEIFQHGERGAGAVAPVMLGNRVLFVQARAGTLRDFYYDYTSDSFVGADLTLCAKHLFFNQQIKELCYQQEPDQLVWCVLSNGQLAALTYLADQNVCAWTHHDTQGFFRSICTIARSGYDEVWFAVERSNGWNIEKMSCRLVTKEPQDQIFLDSTVSYKAEQAFTSVSGLSHLEGQEVGILADGVVLPRQRVSQGTIILPQAACCVQVGLCYTAQLKTLPLAASRFEADALHRPVSVTLQLVDSCGGAVGADLNHLEALVWRSAEAFNEPIALQTGYYPIVVRSAHARGAGIWVEQADPFPFTLIGLKCRVA